MSMDSSDYDINDSATELEEEDVTELEEDFESAEQATVQALESFDNFLDEDDDFYSDEDEKLLLPFSSSTTQMTTQMLEEHGDGTGKLPLFSPRIQKDLGELGDRLKNEADQLAEKNKDDSE
ncbi:hypothetical protein ACOSQ2_033147 [Xanthoceras sorbifolium]